MIQNRNNPSVKINILINTLYEILCIVVPFITTPYLARVLGANGVGINAYVQSLNTYFIMFAALGTASYGKREIARNRDNIIQCSKVFWEIEIVSVITTSICIMFWIMFSLWYKEYRVYMLIYSLYLLAVTFDISWFYVGHEKFIYTISINAFFKIASLIFIFKLIKTQNDLAIYMLIFVLSMLLGNISMWIFLPKMLTKVDIDFKNLKRHFKETMVYFVPTIALSVYSAVDKTLIGLLIPGEQIIVSNSGLEVMSKTADIENGFYEQANKIINMVKIICFSSVNTVFSSRMSYLFKNNELNKIKKIFQSVLDFDLFLSIATSFGLICISKVFVPVFFGPGYEKTVLLMMILAPLVTIMCLNSSLTMLYYTPSGNRKKANVFVIAGAILNIIISAPLVLLYKSIGAAIATIFAELFATFLIISGAGEIINLKEIWKLIYKKLFAGLIMLLICHNVMERLLINGFADVLCLIIVILTGAAVYFLTLLILKDSSISNGKDLLKQRRKEVPNE